MSQASEKSQFQLIGTEVSLYTAKIRAYLRYKKIPFREVLSTAEVYRDIIIPRTGVRFIPIVISDDDVAVQDTSDIIDFCESRKPERSVYPTSPVQKLVSLLLEVYGDEWLVNPAMHYRWSYPDNRAFAIREFGRTNAPEKSLAEQVAIGEKLSQPFAGALPRLGITAATAPAIEESYAELLTELDEHFKTHSFLLGERPCIGDFSFIGPLYAHLYRDPFSGDLMRKYAQRVARWVNRVHRGEGGNAEFLPEDSIPETLLPILQRMFKEQVPVLLSTNERLALWTRENNDIEVPRVIGKHRYHLGKVEEERAVIPYNLWMWQRAHNCYQQLTDPERVKVEDLLATIPNGISALEATLHNRLVRVNNRLQLADRIADNGPKPLIQANVTSQ